MNFFFGSGAEIEIILDGAEKRKTVEHRVSDSRTQNLFVYYDGENVSGAVNINLKPGSKLEHKGVKIELIGQIDVLYNRTYQDDFTTLTKQLSPAGNLLQSKVFTFEFPNVEKSFESYFGSNVRLRYYLKVTVVKRLQNLTKELEFVVHTLSSYPENSNSLKMEVGIEDCLHIEFEYNKQRYHLQDAIIGKIYFLLVRVKIKHMELQIIKRETTGQGQQAYHEEDTVAKYEIMDGAPVKGESIPIRLFLAAYKGLTPTLRDVNKKFSVKYYLNLVLVDEEERRYFKQQEIVLWRRNDFLTNKAKSFEEATKSKSKGDSNDW